MHTLWHRASRRHKWRVVGRHEYGPAALALMDGIRGGEWMLIDDDRDPNQKPGQEPARGEEQVDRQPSLFG